MGNQEITRSILDSVAKRLSNWGKWGEDDQIGTLNYTTPQDIISAASLIRTGEVFSLSLHLNKSGPQGAKGGYSSTRFNPLHLMVKTGTDAYCGIYDQNRVRSADDLIIMPLQAGTHWDALSHIFYDDHMWNGRDCRYVTVAGAQECGIEHTREKMVGRGVLLDIPRHLGIEWLPDGYSIGPELLDEVERRQGITVCRGDFLLVRTGQIEGRRQAGAWDGYNGGDAPGLSFDTLDWLSTREVAGVATDTWGVEVRPNNSKEIVQPFHWIAIPMMGLALGEMFELDSLARSCAGDKRYEFFFVAPPLPFTGAVGAPANPIAIK